MAGSCGPTRNLTPLFLKLRAARKSKKNRFAPSAILGTSTSSTTVKSDEEEDFSHRRRSLQGREGLLSRNPISQHDSLETLPTTATSSQAHTLPPIWVDLVEEANDDLSKGKEKLSALQKVQQQRLLRIFGDDDSLQQPERNVEAISAQITEILRRCETKIRKLGMSTDGPLSDAEMKLRKNAQRNIATQLQSLSKQMRLQQQHYVAELRKRHQLDNDDTTADAGQSLLEDGTHERFGVQETELLSDQVLMSQLEELEHTSDVRHREITRIAQSMAELHGIFKDLNLLVIDQGTILDRIDYNIEQVVSQTGNATRQIRKAEQHQRSGRAGRVILFLVALICLLIGALILKWSM